MTDFRFDEIAININDKRMPNIHDKDNYIGLEHIDTECLEITRWGSDVDITGQKLIMHKGDLLFGRRNTYLKRVAIAPHDGLFSAHGMILRPLDDVVLPEFFPFFIASDYFLDAAIRISVGSLSPTVNWSSLRELQFSMPSLDKQKQVAKSLWAMERTKRAYKQLIVKTDNLVKARFIEMFGDPQNNPLQWPVCTIEDVMRAPASNGFFTKPSDYCADGNAGIICVGDVVNKKYSNTQNLRRANATEKDFAKYSVKYGDMLFCRSSLVKEGIAKASIIPKSSGDDLLFECHVIRIPLNTDVIIPEFMQTFSTMDYFRQQMMDKSKTATMTTIGQKDVVTGVIYVPPVELQQRFVEFTEQSDKSKLAFLTNIPSMR